jgi:predicted nucleic acid-binding protein
MVKKEITRIKEKEEDSRITFDAGSAEIKEKAKEMAKNFKPIKISLSDFCQIALKEFIEKVKKDKINYL